MNSISQFHQSLISPYPPKDHPILPRLFSLTSCSGSHHHSIHAPPQPDTHPLSIYSKPHLHWRPTLYIIGSPTSQTVPPFITSNHTPNPHHHSLEIHTSPPLRILILCKVHHLAKSSHHFIMQSYKLLLISQYYIDK